MGTKGKPKTPVAGGTDQDVVKAAEGIKEKSKLQTMAEQAAERYFNWTNSQGEFAGKPKDILQAPGMDEALDIYGTAERLAAEKRFTPSVALSGQGSAGYAKQLASKAAMDRYDTRASGLNQALQNIKAQAYGLSDQAIGNEMQQKQAYANMLGQYNSNFYNRPQKPPLWQSIAGLAIGGLGAAGSMGLKF
jgi:hypothetical protein